MDHPPSRPVCCKTYLPSSTHVSACIFLSFAVSGKIFGFVMQIYQHAHIYIACGGVKWRADSHYWWLMGSMYASMLRVYLQSGSIGYILGGANGCRSCVTVRLLRNSNHNHFSHHHALVAFIANKWNGKIGWWVVEKRFVRCVSTIHQHLGCEVICDRVSCGFLATFIPYRCAPANGWSPSFFQLHGFIAIYYKRSCMPRMPFPKSLLKIFRCKCDGYPWKRKRNLGCGTLAL